LPLVSVLLPLHNAERTIRPAARSILRQSLRDLELVVVDDGSTDRSATIVEELARTDSRVRLARQDHRGLCAALQLGLSLCRGALVARMDADDISLRDRLAAQVDHLQRHPDVAAVGCRITIVPRALVSDGMRRYEEWSNALLAPDQLRRDLFVESPLCHPSVTIRAELLHALGYRDMGWPEDYDLWLRLDAAGHRLGKVDQALLLWREGPTRLSRVDAAYGRDRFFALKLHHLLHRRSERRCAVWGAGQEGKPWLRALRDADVLADGVVDIDPRKVGQRIHGCRVILPEELGPPSLSRWVVVAVGAAGARQQIREFLWRAGYREPEDFVCVA
jgi:glycosyltransferase involved in cell wall biosynthesis